MIKGIRAAMAAIGMLILILDGKTALTGGREALNLCMNAVIPALFPFFILSPILVGALSARWLRPIGKLCRIPDGAEALLLAGFLGGYPTGAQCIANCFREGALEKEQAQRLLGFCSNAGPSFIFGILGPCFQNNRAPWFLWGIHILSAIIAGILLPPVRASGNVSVHLSDVSLKDALSNAVKAMASVCGWVILFRVVIGFLERYFLWYFPDWVVVTITGMLELTNGCFALQKIGNEGFRFLICAAMLSFGGICVTMQTISVTEGLSIKWYLLGKMYQAGIALALASILQAFFADSVISVYPWIAICAGFVLLRRGIGKMQNSCSNPERLGV